VPEVAYRTVWQPVPVTTYRRTVSTNPATGLPMTCTQPCTTYTYQARRVPYTTFRPVYTTEPVTTPGVVTVPAAAPAAAPAVAAPPTGCNSCGNGTSAWSTVGPSGTTQPGYAAPAPVAQPGYSIPSYAAPSMPSSSPSTGGATDWEPIQPAAPAATGGAGVGAGNAVPPPSNYPSPAATDPASGRPRIDPSIVPNLNGSSSNWQPSDLGTPAAAIGSGAGAAGSSTAPPSSPSLGFGNLGAPSSAAYETNRSFPSMPDVRPLPKLEAPPSDSTQPEIDAPPLLNDPRDRTAIRPIPARTMTPTTTPTTQWASTRIEWPERSAARVPALNARPDADRTPTDAPRRLEPQRLQLKRFSSDAAEPAPVNGSGWRSARR
jgi:hypothetical protein